MTDYIKGALCRAQKTDIPGVTQSKEWYDGYEDMQQRLSPIETTILTATMQYKAVAEKRIQELLEEHTRATAVASSATGSTGSSQ